MYPMDFYSMGYISPQTETVPPLEEPGYLTALFCTTLLTILLFVGTVLITSWVDVAQQAAEISHILVAR